MRVKKTKSPVKKTKSPVKKGKRKTTSRGFDNLSERNKNFVMMNLENIKNVSDNMLVHTTDESDRNSLEAISMAADSVIKILK